MAGTGSPARFRPGARDQVGWEAVGCPPGHTPRSEQEVRGVSLRVSGRKPAVHSVLRGPDLIQIHATVLCIKGPPYVGCFDQGLSRPTGSPQRPQVPAVQVEKGRLSRVRKGSVAWAEFSAALGLQTASHHRGHES